jgi:hypothetical protein
MIALRPVYSPYNTNTPSRLHAITALQKTVVGEGVSATAGEGGTGHCWARWSTKQKEKCFKNLGAIGRKIR